MQTSAASLIRLTGSALALNIPGLGLGFLLWLFELQTHPEFPAGVNVELIKVESPNVVRILIWERGVGPTESSGTGSCASAVAAAAYAGAPRVTDVIAPGGSQRVEWTEDNEVFLTGWAQLLFDGQWMP